MKDGTLADSFPLIEALDMEDIEWKVSVHIQRSQKLTVTETEEVAEELDDVAPTGGDTEAVLRMYIPLLVLKRQ